MARRQAERQSYLQCSVCIIPTKDLVYRSKGIPHKQLMGFSKL